VITIGLLKLGDPSKVPTTGITKKEINAKRPRKLWGVFQYVTIYKNENPQSSDRRFYYLSGAIRICCFGKVHALLAMQ
jgi:hypothetical protein